MTEPQNIPPGAIIPEETIIPGEKKCENCTHYSSEHLEGKKCKALMYELPLDEDRKKYEDAGHFVPKTRQLCSCRKFE